MAASIAMTETIKFNRLPGGSRLFLDYLYDPHHVGAFFAWPFRSEREFESCARLLDNHSAPRPALRDILVRQNREFQADSATFANIDRLARPETLAVFTGQQVGLLGGPLYTFYKALGAIGLARRVEETLQRPVVPIFWLAADDHDFAEVRWTAFPNLENRAQRVVYTPSSEPERIPLSRILLENAIQGVHQTWRAGQLATEFSPAVDRALAECYRPGVSMPAAFGCWMACVFASAGLVLFSPSDEAAKRLTIPLFERELACPQRSARALELANLRLAESGYHQQVSHQPTHTHLFHFGGWRLPLAQAPNGGFTDGQTTQPTEWWINRLKTTPESFSPDVLLRPVIQSFLFPVIAYIAGPAEVAYWAQAKALFEVHEVIQPVVVTRPFVTLVESKIRKAVDRLQLTLPEVLTDPEQVVNTVAQRSFPADLQAAFTDTRECFAERVANLKRAVAAFEPTLERTFGLASGKINAELAGLEKKAFQAHKRKNEILREQVYKISAHLYPDGELQERVYGLPYYVNKYGFGLISYLTERIRLDTGDHQLIDLEF